MKTITGINHKHIQLRRGVSGAMERGWLENDPIALIRESRLRRVCVVGVRRKYGYVKDPICISLERVLHRDFIQESAKVSFDLYVDSDGEISQA